MDPRDLLESELGLNLDGPDGNAWVIGAAVSRWLQDVAGWLKEDTANLREKAQSGNYENLLQVYADAIGGEL